MKITLELSFDCVQPNSQESREIEEALASMQGLESLAHQFGASAVGLVSLTFENEETEA